MRPLRLLTIICCTLWIASSEARLAAQHHTAEPETRQRVELPAPLRDMVLQEMRLMLESTHEILDGLSKADTAAVELAARRSGMVMAADVNPEIQQRLPAMFLQLGMRTHQAFDSLADEAAAGASAEEITKELASITGYCVGCHASFRLDEARESDVP